MEQLQGHLKAMPNLDKAKAANTYNDLFKKLKEIMFFKDGTANKPVVQFEKEDGPENFWHECNILNPYSKITTLAIYLYSMEIGTPPLYAVINKAIRRMDKTYLETLGPLICVLGDACAVGELGRDDEERIPWGMKINPHLENNMGGIFLLFRGGTLADEWIKDWESAKDKKTLMGRPDKICMPGYSSCSEDLGVALRFAFMDKKATWRRCIFVISCQNYECYNGIRMNNDNYTAYPHEQEVLLFEGCSAWVLSVHWDYHINNEFQSMKKYNGEKITLIHLFHA